MGFEISLYSYYINLGLFLLLMGFIGISKAVSDTLEHHYYTSIFKQDYFNDLFWNAEISWKNKYKDITVDKTPKFILSTSLLIFLTDGWHFFNFIRSFSTLGALFMIPFVVQDNITVYENLKHVTIGILFNMWIFDLFYEYILVLKFPYLNRIQNFLKLFKNEK